MWFLVLKCHMLRKEERLPSDDLPLKEQEGPQLASQGSFRRTKSLVGSLYAAEEHEVQLPVAMGASVGGGPSMIPCVGRPYAAAEGGASVDLCEALTGRAGRRGGGASVGSCEMRGTCVAGGGRV